MRNIFKETHKMTREMVEKYDVDYQAQFGLNLSYLLEEKEEEEMLKELKGTEKQIKYANDIADGFMDIVKDLEEAIEKHSIHDRMRNKCMKTYKEEIIPFFESYENAGDFIGDWKHMLYHETKASRVFWLFETLVGQHNIKITARLMDAMRDEYNKAI